MEIVKLNTPNLRDVPAGLRRLADQMEAGQVPAAKHAVVIITTEDNEKTFYLYGETVTYEHVAGLMLTCANRVSAMMVEEG